MRVSLVWDGSDFRLVLPRLRQGEMAKNGVAVLLGIYCRLQEDPDFAAAMAEEGQRLEQAVEALHAWRKNTLPSSAT